MLKLKLPYCLVTIRPGYKEWPTSILLLTSLAASHLEVLILEPVVASALLLNWLDRHVLMTFNLSTGIITKCATSLEPLLSMHLSWYHPRNNFLMCRIIGLITVTWLQEQISSPSLHRSPNSSLMPLCKHTHLWQTWKSDRAISSLDT